MHWASWQEFWAMGGSGRFVWSAYGMVVLALAAEMMLLRARVRRAREAARRTSDWSSKETE
ncbi:MAG TPA: heme exporter protein CcmD [Burkholderiaceae bacterium]|jgi:heme exporter protein D|nr:heme exporter protein CcmD [Burkholderiaceae bacterium]